MKSVEQMKLEASKYLLQIYKNDGECYLVKHSGYVKISVKRAIDWVNAGIKDIDCKDTNKMLEVLNTMLEEGAK